MRKELIIIAWHWKELTQKTQHVETADETRRNCKHNTFFLPFQHVVFLQLSRSVIFYVLSPFTMKCHKAFVLSEFHRVAESFVT